MQKLAIAALLLTATAATQAMENTKTICSHDTTTRVIEVVYTGEGALPCEVQYTKSTEPRVLWSAKNAENYCETKAAELVEKQKIWGWNCVAEEAQVEAEPAVETPAETATSEVPQAETTVEQVTEAQTSQLAETEEDELTL